MITNDATLLKVKHEVLYEVAKLAYDGKLNDERDNLPYKMVPGPQPFFRCCIYRERGRSSDRGSGLLRAKHLVRKMMVMWYRSSILPVKDVRSHVM